MGDLISRKAAIDAVGKYLKKDGDVITIADVVDAAVAIGMLPSAEPERKKGKWLPDNNCAYEMRFVCSCCKESEVVPTIGFTKYRPLWDFCPNCGADMRGEEECTKAQ